MKKLFLIFALMIGGTSINTLQVYATPSIQTCDPNSPCLYTGNAKSVTGSRETIKITVKIGTDKNYIATCSDGNTFYVFQSVTDADKSYGSYYINRNGHKYYFNM